MSETSDTRKRSRGRPPTAPAERKRHRVRINLTDAEYAGLLSARRVDETISGAAVRLLFYEVDPELDEATT